MEDLKKDLVKDIAYLKNSGEKLECRNDIVKLFSTCEFDFKTTTAIKDIVSIIDIDNSLKKILPDDIRKKYFKDYEQWLEKI